MAVGNLRRPYLFNRLAYNSGRVLTYGVQGAIVASVGMAFPFSGFQNILAITLGVGLVLMGISGVSGLRIPLLTPAIQTFTQTLKKLFQKFLQRKSYSSMVMLGALNGLLPCGLTYLALTYCLTLVGPVDGFNFMLLFGAGTLPVMIGLPSLFPYLGKFLRFNSTRVTTVILIAVGSLLITRVFMTHPHINPADHDAAVCIE
jgi:sulfite exporter TauE/SafE